MKQRKWVCAFVKQGKSNPSWNLVRFLLFIVLGLHKLGKVFFEYSIVVVANQSEKVVELLLEHWVKERILAMKD